MATPIDDNAAYEKSDPFNRYRTTLQFSDITLSKKGTFLFTEKYLSHSINYHAVLPVAIRLSMSIYAFSIASV